MQTLTKKSIREFPYFREEDDEDLLKSIMLPDRPLRLPELEVIQRELDNLKELIHSEEFDERALLESYFKLRESHLNTDIFCGWRDKNGDVCGGLMHIKVTAIGAYYQCKLNRSHQTPK